MPERRDVPPNPDAVRVPPLPLALPPARPPTNPSLLLYAGAENCGATYLLLPPIHDSSPPLRPHPPRAAVRHAAPSLLPCSALGAYAARPVQNPPSPPGAAAAAEP
eukprot:m51a1_g13036 hypothetical protein (106) ;mRNA; f:2540-2926